MSWRPACVTLALLTACCCAPGTLGAQDGLAGWTTLANGDEIISLLADRLTSDRLWAGTEGGGLVVWDVRQRTFEQHVYPDQPGLAGNSILDIAIASDGSVWLATDGGVSAFRGTSWRRYGPEHGLPGRRISAIAVTPDGRVWAGARSQGLAVLEPGADSWRLVKANSLLPSAGPGVDRVADLLVEAGSGRLWVAHGRARSGSQPALSLYDATSDRWLQYYPDSDPTKGPPNDQVMALAQTRDGALWLATWARGVVRYDGQQWQAFDEQDGLCGRTVWAIASGADEVWAACGSDTGGDGVARWRNGSWSRVDGDARLAEVVAVAVLDGVAYLGTNGPGELGAGIVPFTGEALEALTTAPTTPFANEITAIAFDEAGRAWVGTRGAGLMRFDGSSWEQYTQETTAGLLVGDTITDLAVRQGQLWVGVTKTAPPSGSWLDGGVSILNLADDTWEDPLPYGPESGCDGLPDREVSSLAIGSDPHETVWIGLGIGSGGPGYERATHQGNGVVAYDPVTDSWECYSYESTGQGAGLAGNTVLDLAVVDDALWVAASYHTSPTDQRRRGGGVSELKAGQWTSWRDDEEGLKTYSQPPGRDPIVGDVRSAGVDDHGAVWMGTWDLDTGELVNVWPYVDAVVNERAGAIWLPHIFPGCGWVSAMATDSTGRLWVGTTRGHASSRHDVEYSAAGGESVDTSEGGLRIWNGSAWTRVLGLDSGLPDQPLSGLASKAITALARHPTTGAMWVGTENGGLAVFGQGAAVATRTPANGATARPSLTPGATFPVVLTIPAPTVCPDCPTPTLRPRPTDLPPFEPPPEVPEAGTLVLLAVGLGGLAVWLRRRV